MLTNREPACSPWPGRSSVRDMLQVMLRLVRIALLSLTSAAFILAAACGDDDEEPAATTPAATASEEPTPTEAPFSGARDPVVATPLPALIPPLLSDIQTPGIKARSEEHT